MTTMNHQYLATWFYDDETIQEVLSNNTIYETDEITDTDTITVNLTERPEKIEYANERNIDFIICDHHRPGDEIPNAIAVLDSKRTDCEKIKNISNSA